MSRVVGGALFDLDGTLLDYEGASNVALNEPLKPFGVEVTWELHSRIVGMRPNDWARIILQSLDVLEKISIPEYIEQYHEAIARLYSTLELMPGALEVVSKFKASNCPVAIATSSTRESMEKKLSYHPELRSMFQVVVTGDDPDLHRGKPAPDIFLLAAQRLGVPIEQCLVFEDSPFGVQAGVAAGSSSCYHLPDPRIHQGPQVQELYNPPPAGQTPVFRLGSFHELSFADFIFKLE